VRALLALATALLVGGCGSKPSPTQRRDPCVHGSAAVQSLSPAPRAIKTVFLVVMENRNWSEIQGSRSAPFINQTLLPQASLATRYTNAGVHPSEPNYLWLEGGTNYGIADDGDPAQHHLGNRDHLVSLLTQAGIPWKAYQQGIDGSQCPVESRELYAAKHDPFVFFDDVTDGNNAASANCIAHVRPLEELTADLQNGAVARYNFVTPDLCNDMHGTSGCPVADAIAAGDAWLAEWIPRIMQSRAYADGGAIFITWDEADANDQPIGLIVLSPLAKGAGYSNAIPYSHSSTLRSLQEIFDVGPLLCDAAKAESLGDLFVSFP
jgi:phosphatidylinositol-3-phosphatase